MKPQIDNTKIAVISLSGNTGKTMISQYLLKPRIKNSMVISVETINDDGLVSDSEKVKGKNFLEIQKFLDNNESIIVDIGSSNVEQFMEQLVKYDGSHEDFDYFVVPTVPVVKQLNDTIKTISYLLGYGIEGKKIKVVLNKVDDVDSITFDFGKLINFHKSNGGFHLNLDAVITNNEFYQLNSTSGKSIAEILEDNRDLKQLIKESQPNSKERIILGNQLAIKRLASGVEKQLDAVFATLFLN